MGIARGPNIIKDNLVFGYDTGYGVADNETSTRFYPGRPTTSYGPSSLGDWGTENTAQRIATGNTYKGQPTYNCRTAVGASWQGIDKTISGLRTAAGSSGTVTVSCYIKNNNNTSYPCYAYIGHDFSSTRTVAANSDWQRIQWTVNQSSMNNDYVELRPYTNNASTYMEMTMPMVEVNVTTATPFLIGTRSSTQSLIDLKRTTNIDVSNVSFNSTGQPTFDGTDDEINTGITTQLTDFSCVVVFKDSSSAAWGRMVDKSYTTGFFISSYFASVGAGYVGCGIIEPSSPHGQALQYDTSKYNYFVVTRSGSTHTIYLNGSTNKSQKTNGSSATLSSTEMAIGAWYGSNNSQRYTGEIPVVKLYNKELTAAEIQQDFEAYKNRFNL